MRDQNRRIPKSFRDQYREMGPDCPLVPYQIDHLSDYFEILDSVLKEGQTFWFRGHADFTWKLTPSVLRYSTQAKRDTALGLVSEFRRLAEIKLATPPGPDDDLKWVQLAQHYGLPTRLLDWTQNAAIALYFACLHLDRDGLVFVLDPVDLNRTADPKKPRVFSSVLDAPRIQRYLKLSGRRYRKKLSRRRYPKRATTGATTTIAILPTWNSDRIMIQQGVFTLHGSRDFTLDSKQAPLLVAIPILRQAKERLARELERVGVSEMSIFPEIEHVCGYLKSSSGLRS